MVKGRFHGPTNDANEMENADRQVSTEKIIDRHQRMKKPADNINVFRSPIALCMVTDLSLAWRVETDRFCLQEQPTNEVFDGRPTLFEMFNILNAPIDERKRRSVV